MARAGYLSSNAETIAGLRVGGAARHRRRGVRLLRRAASDRSRAWLPTVLAVETAWLALQLAARGRDRGGWDGPDRIRADIALADDPRRRRAARADRDGGRVLAPRVRRARTRARAVRAPRSRRSLRRALPFAASGIVANVQTRVGPLMLGYLSTPTELGCSRRRRDSAASRGWRRRRCSPARCPCCRTSTDRDRDVGGARVSDVRSRPARRRRSPVAIGCAMFAAPGAAPRLRAAVRRARRPRCSGSASA